MSSVTLLGLARLAIGMAALALPGWLLSRRIESGARPLAVFLGSSVILFQVVLLLMVLGLPLHLGTVGCGLGVVSLLLACGMPRRDLQTPSGREVGARGPAVVRIRRHLAANWQWWAAVACGMGSIGARAVIEPLSGFDNIFRWDHLARLMVTHQSLASYPPVTAEHFGLHAWCDGIPPLVSFLNFWIYAAAGSTNSTLTAVRVVGEALLIGWTVARFSRELWGRGAEIAAVAALATSALVLWSIAMGQESALVTLSFVALLYFLFRYRATAEWSLIVWAAIAAAVGGLSREYGLSFVLMGALLLRLQSAPVKHNLLFMAVATALAAPWYLRNWVVTGNPLYPHSPGGLFPTNPVHAEIMAGVGRQWSFVSGLHSKIHLAQALALSLGLVAVFATAGAIRARGRLTALWVGCGWIAAFWLWAATQTGGGWYYSLRLLAPAVAVGAVFCGWIVHTRPVVRVVLGLVFVVASIEAAHRSWNLPVRPLAAEWPWDFSGWAETRRRMDAATEKAIWPILVREAGTGSIVVEHTLHHPAVWAVGGRPVPLMSPALAPTLGPDRRLPEVLGALAASRIRFIVIDRARTTARELGARHQFWRELADRPSTVDAGALSIYDLRALNAAAAEEKL